MTDFIWSASTSEKKKEETFKITAISSRVSTMTVNKYVKNDSVQIVNCKWKIAYNDLQISETHIVRKMNRVGHYHRD